MKKKCIMQYFAVYFLISLCFASSGFKAFAGGTGYKDIHFGAKIEQLRSVCPQLEIWNDNKEGFCRDTKIFGEPGLIYLDFENNTVTGIRLVINFKMNKLKELLNLLKTRYKSSFSSDLAMFEKTGDIDKFIIVFEEGKLLLNASKNQFKGAKIVLSYRNKKYTQHDWDNIKQVYTNYSDY